MAKTSKLRVGVDVPWVTSWSEEPMLGVRPCPAVEGRLALHQAQNPGVGRPNYSQNHLNRQRQSMRGMFCPMCGQPTAEGDRWSQTATYTSVGDLRARGLAHLVPRTLSDGQAVLNAGAIAPLHRACAERAVTHCPHLGGMADKSLKPFPNRRLLTPLHVLATPPPPARGEAVPVVSFLQLLGLIDD